jgi:hypothetical protein
MLVRAREGGENGERKVKDNNSKFQALELWRGR